ncbi:hypothetical protein [Pseudorhodoplanes sinuspersici]|uniref:Uncharacterized protein n=1 Tax=Pseudorhodoplanes sinuspersici TaxID=1235591 RepID=A0A1W6ZND5_9HYPH|nr:hypothetical protein [Pseudorhodoplanes sinuspersici]ARP98871.1 hypothetical protein CAK95_07110 [Pseudorhodoplanes sinuspersici]RKE69506.1 hypothetical protein DFP91_3939 [Pseudorhodoplanes sinuspersici]
MSIRLSGILTAATTFAVLTFTLPADALTMHECSLKYKAARSAGTLGGMKWNDFRRAQCGDGASAAMTAPAPAAAPTPSLWAAQPPAAQPSPWAAQPSAQPSPSPWAARPAPRDYAPNSFARAGDAQFPMGVSPKYASESVGKARMHTCLDQYRANKASGGNAGLKWIQKGGGYYSECNKRLGGR